MISIPGSLLRHSGRSARVAVAIVAVIVVAACSRDGRDAGPPVAKVGDETLTARDLNVMIGGLPDEAASPDARWEAAERWVNRELLYGEAVKLGIHLDPDVAAQVRTAARELVINALLDRYYQDRLAVSDEEVQAYYDEHRAVFRRPETTVRIHQIVLEAVREARSVSAQLRHSPQTFEEIARLQSADPSSSEGGDLGYISASTAYTQEIWQAIHGLSEGEISGRIRSDAGWHILRVDDRRLAGSIRTLDEVRLEIVNRIRATKRWVMVTELVERLRLQESYVFYGERLGPRERPRMEIDDTLSVLEDIDAHE